MDNKNFHSLSFSHCTFSNVSFKLAHLNDVTFKDCTFASCYFRGTQVKSCTFTGCRFIDCDLSKIDIRTTDLKFYNHFENSPIPFRVIEPNLPSEGNLRAYLCSNLARESYAAGEMRDSGKYKFEAARAMERHLWAAFRGSTLYYKQKYSGFDRFSAGTEWASSRIRGYAWGYKSSFWVVLRNLTLLVGVIFPVLYLFDRDGLRSNGVPAQVGDVWLASVANTLPGAGLANISFVSTYAHVIGFSQVLLSLLLAGIAGSLLFRAVFDRW